MTHQISAAAYRDMIINGAAAIESHKNEINELNVFPVPDGDTGTNMSLTMNAGAKAMAADTSEPLGKTVEVNAGALLRGARGNSGVILSLLFRGMARHLKEAETADAPAFAAALEAGVTSAYNAVMKPAEGTILTVSRLAAREAAAAAENEPDIELVLERALAAGQAALRETVNQNPVLKKAGVVDAGGKGYLYILDGMLRALRGEMLEVSADGDGTLAKADFAGFAQEDIAFTYCTEFIVSRENEKSVRLLQAFLDARGDSLVLVDDETMIKVHVHTDEPGVALTEALTYGPLLTVKIENMREQHTEQVIAQESAGTAEPEKTFGVVSVSAGDGMAAVFRDLGVDRIITGGQTMNPSTEDILQMVEAAPAETVYVLPNNKNIIMAAEQCVPLSGKRVIVIPSKSIPQGISAMLAFDPAAGAEENTAAMTQALAHVQTAQITLAARDSEFDGQLIREGEYLALVEGALAASGSDLTAVVDAVCTALSSGDPEFINIFTGEDAGEAERATVLSLITDRLPNAETNMIEGGQPVYHFIVSAE